MTTDLDPSTIKNRFAKALGVSAQSLWLTAKDLEEVLPRKNPARLSQLLEEVATLPAKDLEALQAILDPNKAERKILLLKSWASPLWAKLQAKLSAKEQAQDNLQRALRGFEIALEALQGATKRARDALKDGNTCDAGKIFKGALEDAQTAFEELTQAQTNLQTF